MAKLITHKLALGINEVWYGRSWWILPLLPVSALFWLLSAVRKYIYYRYFKKPRKFINPIVVVGNITVGGTGKTPMVVYLCEQLKKLGYSPGVASRGYGVDVEEATLIAPTHRASEVGDEPLLIARNAQVPVVVAKTRSIAIEQLIEQEHCNVIVCDDGLQDYRFIHDIDICMVDGQRLFGNGYVLPAGPLRETTNRAADADFCVTTEKSVPELSPYCMNLQFAQLVNVGDMNEKIPLNAFSGQTVHAVAGLGNPQRFFTLLRNQGLHIIEHSYPDHMMYTQDHFCFSDQHPVLMTEKDAVKCDQLGLQNAWYLPVRGEVSEDFTRRIELMLRESDG